MSDLYKGGPTHDEILSGGASIEIELVDRATGKFAMSAVLVRLLPVKDYPALRRALDDEAEQVRLYLRSDLERIGSGELTPASHELVMDVSRRVNAHFFDCWLPRRREIEEQSRSELSEDLIAVAAREFVASYKQQQTETEPSATSGRTSPIAPPVGAKHWKPSA